MMFAVQLPVKATTKGDFSSLGLYRLEWRYLKKDGSEAQPADPEDGVWRKVNSKSSPGGSVSAIGPDGTVRGESVTRQQAYARDTAVEMILRPLLPGVESPNPDPAKV